MIGSPGGIASSTRSCESTAMFERSGLSRETAPARGRSAGPSPVPGMPRPVACRPRRRAAAARSPRPCRRRCSPPGAALLPPARRCRHPSEPPGRAGTHATAAHAVTRSRRWRRHGGSDARTTSCAATSAGGGRRRSRGARSACCARSPASSRPASGCRAHSASTRRIRSFSSSTTPDAAVGRPGSSRRRPARTPRAAAGGANVGSAGVENGDRIGGHGLDRKVLGQDLRPVAQQQRALDDVAHLAHVALPWIDLEQRARPPARSPAPAGHPPRARTARAKIATSGRISLRRSRSGGMCSEMPFRR